MNIAALSDQELIALLVGKKTAAKLYQGKLAPLVARSNLQPIHRKLMASIEFARRTLYEELQLGRALTSPPDTADYLRMHFMGMAYEAFVVIYLDSRHRVITIDEMFKGTINGAEVHPREVVRAALQYNAAACILAHNHPSGSSEASAADRAVTARLKQALALIEVRVLDHFIIAGQVTTSFAQRGWL